MEAQKGMKVYILYRNTDSGCTWGWDFQKMGVYAARKDAEIMQQKYIEKISDRGGFKGIYGVPIVEEILK